MTWWQWTVFLLGFVFWGWNLRRPLRRQFWRFVGLFQEKPVPTVCCDCRRNFGRFPEAATTWGHGRPLCQSCADYASTKKSEVADEVRRSRESYEFVPTFGLLARDRPKESA